MWTASPLASAVLQRGLLPSWRGHQDFLGQVVPAIQLQDSLVVASKGAGGFCLPEDPGACPDEVVVEQSLMEAPLEPLPVDAVESFSALVDAQKPVACLALRCSVKKLLQCVALDTLGG